MESHTETSEAFSQKPNTRRFHVRVSGKNAIRFPPVCPHCLQPATNGIRICSSPHFTGFYVAFVTYREMKIAVPFCSKFRRTRSWIRVLWWIGFSLLFALSIFLAPDYASAEKVKWPFYSLGVWILVALCCFPLTSVKRFIDLSARDYPFLDFVIVDRHWAEEFARLNSSVVDPRSPKGLMQRVREERG